MTNELKNTRSSCWTPERRAAQAARIRARKPWLKSTGPRSRSGKRASRMNAVKHGYRGAEIAKFLKLLSLQKRFVSRWRAGRYHPPKRRFLSILNRVLTSVPYSGQQKYKQRVCAYASRKPNPG